MENKLPALVKTDLIPIDFNAEIDALCAALDTLIISDLDSYERAAVNRKAVKTMVKKLEARRKEYTQPLDERKQDIMVLFAEPKNRLDLTDKNIASRMVAWDAEQQRVRDEEQRKYNEALKLQAEKERQAAEAEALRAIQQGRDTEAKRLIEKAEEIKAPEVILEPVRPIAKGVHYRDVWQHEITDFAALPDDYKLPNDVLLGQIARSRHDAAAIPGVRFYAKKVLAQR